MRCQHWWTNGAWWALIGTAAWGVVVGMAIAKVLL